MDPLAVGLFLGSATALLGSPGPGIAALLAVGRVEGLSGGLRYYAGLQLGLAAAAAVSAIGLASLLRAFPSALRALMIIAASYLVWLAYKIATAPVGSALGGKPVPCSPTAGLLLGITNPKGYVAFASLLASQTLLPRNPGGDIVLKWILIVVVILAVDFAWLLVGVALKQAALRPRSERILNGVLGAAVLGAAAATFR